MAFFDTVRSGVAPADSLARPVADPTAAALDRAIWAGIGATALVAGLGALVGGFTVMWSSFAFALVGIPLLLAAERVYRRRDLRLAAAAGGTAQIAAFTAFGAPLSYLAASLGLPLQDQPLDAIDRALGLDWPALLAWMNQNAVLHPLFNAAYLSFAAQATLTILALAFTARLAQLRLFIVAFMLAAVVTIAISALVPALGIWGHYGLSATDHPAIVPATREVHLPIFLGLRDGSFRLLMGKGSEGIITFPSLHAALGVIFILAMWPVPGLRWIALAVNLLMIAATPVDGGHYFIDIVAGIAVALACWAAARTLARRAERRHGARSPLGHRDFAAGTTV